MFTTRNLSLFTATWITFASPFPYHPIYLTFIYPSPAPNQFLDMSSEVLLLQFQIRILYIFLINLFRLHNSFRFYHSSDILFWRRKGMDTEIWRRNLSEREHLDDIGTDGSLLLKYFLKEWAWSGFI